MSALLTSLLTTVGCRSVAQIPGHGAQVPGPVVLPPGHSAQISEPVVKTHAPGAQVSEPPAQAPENGTQSPALGINVSLHGKRIFPATSPWNTDISKLSVDPNSDTFIESIGRSAKLHPDFGTSWEGRPIGMQYVVVSGNQQRVPVEFTYKNESDPGPYPIPADAPIEGGPQSDGDRHVLVIDRDAWKLYETFNSKPQAEGGVTTSWKADSGAIFDMTTGEDRPLCWTSADAAGLPIFPGLVRYDEVFERGVINHALRFTAVNTQRAFVAPARHFASSKTSENLPPLGIRLRLKASYDISGFPPEAQVILKALKKYGMFLADNGSNLFLSGQHDPRWSDDRLGTLKRVHTEDFEVVKIGTVITRCP